MKVTVENRVEVEADIDPRQIEAYLRRRGWAQRQEADGAKPAYWERPGRMPLVQLPSCSGADLLTNAVLTIAAHEKRQPGDVLLDIAKAGAEFRGVLDGVERLP